MWAITCKHKHWLLGMRADYKTLHSSVTKSFRKLFSSLHTLSKVPMHCCTCSHHNTSHKLRPVMLPLLDDRLLRPAALSCWALVEISQAKPSLLFPTNMPHKLKPVMRPLADDHLLRPAALSCCALVETTEAKPSLLLLTNMAHKLRPVMRPLACGHVLRPVALSCCALVETTEANPSLVLFTET